MPPACSNTFIQIQRLTCYKINTCQIMYKPNIIFFKDFQTCEDNQSATSWPGLGSQNGWMYALKDWTDQLKERQLHELLHLIIQEPASQNCQKIYNNICLRKGISRFTVRVNKLDVHINCFSAFDMFNILTSNN